MNRIFKKSSYKYYIVFVSIILICIILFLLKQNESSEDKGQDFKTTEEVTGVIKENDDKIIITEKRRVEVKIDGEFEIDRNKLLFKTNANGEFKAKYIFSHSTLNDEKFVFYALTEDGDSLLTLEVNNIEDTHHFLNTSKTGVTEVDFSILDVPSGKNIIYIISEKLIDETLTDSFARKQNQEVFSANHFSLEDNKKDIDADRNKTYIKLEKINDSSGMDLTPLKLYEDEQLESEVISVKDGNYYLSINNAYSENWTGTLNLLNDYNLEKKYYLKVPANSETMIPIQLTELENTESIRFLLFVEPDLKGVELPLRIIHFSKRIPVE